MRKNLLRTGVAISAVVFLSTLSLWIGGTEWFGRRSAFARQAGFDGGAPLTDVGEIWLGIYACHGRIGLVRLEDGVSALDPTEIAASGSGSPLSSRWFWNRDGSVDSYLGNVPEIIEYADVGWQVPHCVTIYTGEDAGMRHFEKIHAVMLGDWLILVIAGIPVAIFTGGAIRRSRRVFAGRCIRCGYDLRASPTRCPECGIQRDAVEVARQ